MFLTFLTISPASSWPPFFLCGPSQSYKRAIGEVSEGLLGSPLFPACTSAGRHPSSVLLLPQALLPPLISSSLQDFVLLKERTLDEAPKPPKKAMDYSSSSEEVESSEEEEEEGDGEPSEGSRDTPGGRYGVS